MSRLPHFPTPRQRRRGRPGLPLMALILLLSLAAATPALAVESARILIVHAYSQEYPWTKGQHEGFVSTLSKSLPLPPSIKTEYLDSKRLGLEANYLAWFADYLGQKYQGFLPQLIYVTDDDGLKLGLEVQARGFPEIPLIFSGVNDYHAQEGLDPDRQTGVFEHKDIGPNLDLLQALPGAKGSSVVIVGDGSTTYRAIAHEIEAELAKRPGIQATFIAGASLEALQARLAETPGPLLLTTLGGLKGADGQVLNLEQSIPALVAGRDIVLSMEDAYQFDGVLGGYVTSGLAQGETAAHLAVAYLSGRPLRVLPPVLNSPNEYLFDDTRLGALGIRLPEEIAAQARLLNRRLGFVERHLQAILAATLVLLLILAFLLIFLVQLRRKNRLLKQQTHHLRHQERLIRESEERYRRLFELSEDPMLVIHDRHFVMANDATARFLGYADATELLRTHPSKLSPTLQPDGQSSFAKAEALFDEAEAKGFLRFEWEHLRKDGSPRLIDISLTRIPHPGGGEDFFCVWHDITEWRRAEAQLIEQKSYLDGILSASATVGFIGTDLNLDIRYYNQAAARICGADPDLARGGELSFSQCKTQGLLDEHALQQARDLGEFRLSLTKQIGQKQQYVDARISPIRDQDQERMLGYLVMAENVTKRHETEALIRFQAAYDALTQLPNRVTLLDRLAETLERCRHHHHFGAILVIDLDSFKHINDSLGHPVGDKLLQAAAQRILASKHDEDTVARLGGDEFVILLSELGDQLPPAIAEATRVAEDVIARVAEPFDIDGTRVHTTTSIGITLFPLQAATSTDILKQADTAMYQAKEAGRNTFSFFSPEMQQQIEERMHLLEHLRQALAEHRLEVWYQPQIDDQDQLVGVEALVRWRHPDLGMIPPTRFIPLAEESGLIEPLSHFVLNQALATRERWARDFPTQAIPRLSVNVSALQFRKDSFVEQVRQALAETGADPRHLILEITESMLVGDVEATVAKMQSLKETGVRFSIDDFGTGYSSLAYIKRLPISEIKIDRSFVQDMLENPNDSVLVATIIGLSHQLKLEVVAEGVETEAMRDALLASGCRLFQGYYFSPPLPAGDFDQKYFRT